MSYCEATVNALLFEAALANDEEGIAMALERGAEPGAARIEDGMCALALAASRNAGKAATRLLRAGANPDAPEGQALAEAIRAEARGGGSVVALLLRHGANPNALGGQPLALAAGMAAGGALAELLRRGADPRANGWRASKMAKKAGCPDLSKAMRESVRLPKPRPRLAPESPGKLARLAATVKLAASGGAQPGSGRPPKNAGAPPWRSKSVPRTLGWNLYEAARIRARSPDVWRRMLRGDFESVEKAKRAAGLRKRASDSPAGLADAARSLSRAQLDDLVRRLLDFQQAPSRDAA